MVDYLPEYLRLLQRALAILDELLALYTPDQQAEGDWAARCVLHTQQQRSSLAQPPTSLTAEDTSTVTVSLGHYLDSHWADYQQLPTADPTKRAQLLALHRALEAVMNDLALLHNALRAS